MPLLELIAMYFYVISTTYLLLLQVTFSEMLCKLREQLLNKASFESNNYVDPITIIFWDKNMTLTKQNKQQFREYHRNYPLSALNYLALIGKYKKNKNYDNLYTLM